MYPERTILNLPGAETQPLVEKRCLLRIIIPKKAKKTPKTSYAFIRVSNNKLAFSNKKAKHGKDILAEIIFKVFKYITVCSLYYHVKKMMVFDRR